MQNVYIFAQVTKVVYGIPQEGKITKYSLVQHLVPYIYHPSKKLLGLWRHVSCPINSTLVVDDFGVKYSGNENTLYLKSALEDKYKVTIEWEGKFYIGISL